MEKFRYVGKLEIDGWFGSPGTHQGDIGILTDILPGDNDIETEITGKKTLFLDLVTHEIIHPRRDMIFWKVFKNKPGNLHNILPGFSEYHDNSRLIQDIFLALKGISEEG